MSRWRFCVVAVAAGLASACTAPDDRAAGTATLAPDATVVQRPTQWPPGPEHRIGFAPGRYVNAIEQSVSGPRAGEAYTIETPDQRRALDLAHALGFGDAPMGFALNPWAMRRGSALLQIWPDSGGRWEYKRSPASNGSPSMGPQEPQALKQAEPILRAAGLDPSHARAERVDSTTIVTLEPHIGAHPTWGWETKIQLDGEGVDYAVGWLGAARAGPEYQLLDVTQVLARLQAQATEPPAVGPICPAAFQPRIFAPRNLTPPCVNMNAVHTVTGARFAIALDWGREGYHPRLVPAWVFTVQSSHGTAVAVPA
jgi:hypothetical protein